MIQPVGENPNQMIHLGNKSVPRYFVDTFLLPWCEEAYSKKNYDEKKMIEDIEKEVKKLDMQKVKTKKGNTGRGRFSSVATATSEVKCVARVCKYTGINSSNKAAVGVCARCGSYEHFECSKTKQEDRDGILKGELKYFCSVCFSKNPSMIAFDTNKCDKDPVGNTTPPSSSAHIIPKVIFKCSDCIFETNSNDGLKAHQDEVHGHEGEDSGKTLPILEERQNHTIDEHTKTPSHHCSECDASYSNMEELDNHVSSTHMNKPGHSCSICKEEFSCKNNLEAHIDDEHKKNCPLCSLTFNDNTVFYNHFLNEHAPTCSTCNEKFKTTGELEMHIEGMHKGQTKHSCHICDEKFDNAESLNTHISNVHVKCPLCSTVSLNEVQHKDHIEEQHNFECNICAKHFQTKTELEGHKNSNHYSSCPMCNIVFNSIDDFSEHFKAEHIFQCGTCAKEFGTKDDLERHINITHTHVCNTCKEIFNSETLLKEHKDGRHSNKCQTCGKSFQDKSNLTEHIKQEHEYVCEMCDFIGITEGVMEQHILLKHVNPDDDNMFNCDECNYKCRERSVLGNHYREEHKNKTLNKDMLKLRDELKSLKSNFKRLEALYQETLEEADKNNSEYEAKLMEANDKFRVVKAENEELKEKVDVLFKLGRSYINRKEDEPNRVDSEPSNEKQSNKETIEIIDVEEINDEDLQAWTTNKLRGFKRTGPATYAEKVKEPGASKTKQTPAKKKTAPENHDHPASLASVVSSQSNISTKQRRTLYCHYFSNLGTCPYEERTGEKCKFVHDKGAPMCSNGMSCSRPKCMYKHPNTSGRRTPFLGQNMSFNQNMNPWQMMNPWWNFNLNQTQMPNPWGMEGNMNMERR